METFYVRKIAETKKLKKELEAKLNVRLEIKGNYIVVDGSSLDEYDASRIFGAIGFGFSVRKALLLKGDEMIFKIVHIKSHTKRNLKDVLSRIIGKKGKTKRTISEISGCEILIKDGEVGIIGDVESVEDTETAIINLIKGSKQSNTYRYLEKRNKIKKESTSFDDLPR
jgi:ribosomal RNA assembly protein